MIRTNNPEIDAMIEVLQAQRNEAHDAVAILSAKLHIAEVKTASAEARLKELEVKNIPPDPVMNEPGVAG